MQSDFIIMGKKLRDLRKEKRLNQQELGELIGVTKVSICGYEKGTRTPTLETLKKLVDVLNTSIDYLTGKDLYSKENDIYISKNDYEIIQEIKKNKNLYLFLTNNPNRATKIIIQKLKKIIQI